MRTRLKLLFSPDGSGGGGAFALPTPAAAPGEVVGVITSGNDAAPAAPAQNAPTQSPAIPQGNNAVPPTTTTEHNVVIQTENDGWDPWKQIAKVEPGPQLDPNAPPAPGNQQAPGQPPAQSALGENTFISEDGQWINVYKPHPHTGQMGLYTKVANTPAAISGYLQNQLAFIDQLRAQQFQQPPPQQMQPPPQAPPPALSKQDLAALAAEIYGDDVEVGPIAKYGEKLLEMAENRVLERVNKEQRVQNMQQRQMSEYHQIRAEDPTFDLSTDQYTGLPVNRLAHQIMRDYPNLGAREVHAMYTYWNSLGQRQQQPQGQQAPQQPQAPNPPLPPVREPFNNHQGFQRPAGSSPQGTSMADVPYVTEAVQAYYKIMGNKATPQGAANARQDAINLVKAGGNQL